jgi:uncharacterized protein (TIGR02611 family)
MAGLSGERVNSQVSDVDSNNEPDSDNAGIANATDKPLRRGRLDRSLEKLRRTRFGRLAVKIGITVLGTAVIGLGLILVPLPGPGWLIVFAGLAIWSLEFHWARRLNRYVRSQVSAWTSWYGRQAWPMRIGVGFAMFVFVVAILGSATYLSFGAAPFHAIGIDL